MSLIGYPTIGQVLQSAAEETVVPALALLIPIWLATRILRRHHARRTFGTTRPTRSQVLALYQNHAVLRHLTSVATALTAIAAGLAIQPGIP